MVQQLHERGLVVREVAQEDAHVVAHVARDGAHDLAHGGKAGRERGLHVDALADFVGLHVMTPGVIARNRRAAGAAQCSYFFDRAFFCGLCSAQ
jgi:hypothetical protein